jgi:GNAT superfamily N-acetyltransferase
VADVTTRRARIEEIRPLAERYARESARAAQDGQPFDAPIPQGGIFWLAEDGDTPVGYAAGTLRPTGCVVGPVYTEPDHRRRGVGETLLLAVQDWAGGTRVPVVEISVQPDNEDGVAFLQALGYRPRRVLMTLTPSGRDRGPQQQRRDGAQTQEA